MDYEPLTKADHELIEAAKAVIRDNYVPGRHHVGAAIRGKSGRIFVGVHLESAAIDVCAEAVALGAAASNGEREYDCIVAVTMAGGGEPRVLSPCGACRELLRFYGPAIGVIFVQDGVIRKAEVRDLLPGAYVDS
jgi:cytidine deaminase